MITKRLCASILVGMFSVGAAAQDAPKWITPKVEGYGAIVYDPSLPFQPDKTLEYNVVFKITSDDKKSGVNSQLWHVARFVNLLAAAKVPETQAHIVAVVAGKATSSVLTEAEYAKRFGKPNPDAELIRKLADAGVTLYVCSQAAAEHGIDMSTQMNKRVLPSLSLMTDVADYQIRGYKLMP